MVPVLMYDQRNDRQSTTHTSLCAYRAENVHTRGGLVLLLPSGTIVPLREARQRHTDRVAH